MFTIVKTNPVSFGFCSLLARAAYRAAAGSAWSYAKFASEERHESVRFILTGATQNESNGALFCIILHYSALFFWILLSVS